MDQVQRARVEQLAKIGYAAYGDKAEWRAYNGETMPEWVDLPEHIRERWIAAAIAISNHAMVLPAELVKGLVTP